MNLHLIKTRRSPEDEWVARDAAMTEQQADYRCEMIRDLYPGHEVRVDSGVAQFASEPLPRPERRPLGCV